MLINSFFDLYALLTIENDGSTGNNDMQFDEYTNTNDPFLAITKSTSSSFYDGVIDEVKVYNIALTDAQAKTEYNAGKSQVLGSLSTTSAGVPSNSISDSYCPPGQGSTCVGPIREYSFDENTGSTAYDTSGNGDEASLVDIDTAKSWVPGKVGQALDFRLSDSGYYGRVQSIVSDPVDYTGGNMSMEAWVYQNIGEGQGFIISKPWNGGGDYNDWIRLNSNDTLQVQLKGATQNTQNTTETLPEGQWSDPSCPLRLS